MNGYALLKWTFGLLPIIVGIDKFTNLLAEWHSYLAPQIASLFPFDPVFAVRISGVGEIILGIVILAKWARIGAFIEVFWFLAIAINLILLGAYDIALRDIVLALCALSLGFLSSRSG